MVAVAAAITSMLNLSDSFCTSRRKRTSFWNCNSMFDDVWGEEGFGKFESFQSIDESSIPKYFYVVVYIKNEG